MNSIEFHSNFLNYLGDKIDPSSRTNARQKLTLLSDNQFGELATDIHDELKRRISAEKIPFLQVRSDYHPKRNQARQKLATLPEKRFKDLVIDVVVELERRYPELNTSSLKSSKEFKSEPQKTESLQPRSLPKEKETKPHASTSDLNFANLDSLMKDLGDLVTESDMDAISNKNKKESMMSLDFLPKSEDSAKLRKEKELLEKKYKLLESDLEKERIKTTTCQKEINSSHIEIQKVKSEIETINTKRGVVEKELEKIKELLEKEKQLRQQEKRELDSKLLNKEQELKEKDKVIMVLKAESAAKIDELSSKIKQLEQKPKNTEMGSQTNLAALSPEKSPSIKSPIEKPKPVAKSMEKLDKSTPSPSIKSPHSIDHSPEKSPEKSPKSPEKLEKPISMLDKSDKAIDHSIEKSLEKLDNLGKKPKKLPWDVQRSTIITSQIIESVSHEELSPSVNGGLQASRMAAFQSSADGLLESQKSGIPADILVSMKAIVIACKNITNDVEIFELNCSDTNKSSLGLLKTQLSSSLTFLMTASKNHATGLAKGSSKGRSEEIDKGCHNLTDVIIKILKIVKFKLDAPNEEDIPLKKLQDMSQDTKKTVMSSTDLKVLYIHLDLFGETNRRYCSKYTATAISNENRYIW